MKYAKTSAKFSPCEKYRYTLGRLWNDVEQPRYLNFLMLNPSTADAEKNDPTVERCERRAREWGYDGLIVTNIFALRSTDPRALRTCEGSPVGEGIDNDLAILNAAHLSQMTIGAWGNHGSILNRAAKVCDLFYHSGYPLHALRVAKTGHPCHPLYLPYDLKPVPFEFYPRRSS